MDAFIIGFVYSNMKQFCGCFEVFFVGRFCAEAFRTEYQLKRPPPLPIPSPIIGYEGLILVTVDLVKSILAKDVVGGEAECGETEEGRISKKPKSTYPKFSSKISRRNSHSLMDQNDHYDDIMVCIC